MPISMNSVKCGWEECKGIILPKQQTLERGNVKYDCARTKTPLYQRSGGKSEK